MIKMSRNELNAVEFQISTCRVPPNFCTIGGLADNRVAPQSKKIPDADTATRIQGSRETRGLTLEQRYLREKSSSVVYQCCLPVLCTTSLLQLVLLANDTVFFGLLLRAFSVSFGSGKDKEPR